MMTNTRAINEIFESISGEPGPVIQQGAWCTFIRVQGCNLNCNWCDTRQAQEENMPNMDLFSISFVSSAVLTKNVIITGGEPLLNPAWLSQLLWDLYMTGHTIQIETNGSLPLKKCSINKLVFPRTTIQNRIGWVVDYKCPSSNQTDKMPSDKKFVYNWDEENAQFKFVVTDELDLDFAIKKIDQLDKLFIWRHTYLLSPINANLKLTKTIFKEFETNKVLQKKGVLALQIHKLVGAK